MRTILCLTVVLTFGCFNRGASFEISGRVVTVSDDVPSDGSTPAIVKVQVDVNGRPLTGVRVIVTSSGAGVVQQPPLTDDHGVCYASIVSEVPGPQTLTAVVVVGELSVQLAQKAHVTFVPYDESISVPSITASSFSASPSTVVADGTTTTLLIVTLADAQNNRVPNIAVTFTSDGNNNVFAPASGVISTNASGIAALTLASTAAQVKNVKASTGSLLQSATVTFVAGAPSASTSSLLVSPTIRTADGLAAATLSVTAKDAYGNPLDGQPVSFSASGVNNTFTPPSGVTSAGALTASLKSTKAQSETVTAWLGAVNMTAQMTFVAGSPDANMTVFSSSPITTTADGNSAIALTVTVEDATGNPVAGQTVSFAGNGSANLFAPASANTNGSGTLTSFLTSTLAQTESITATIGSFMKSTPVNFVAGPANSATSTLTANPNSLVADNNVLCTLVATLKDAQNNPVTGQNITFTSSGTGNTFAANSGTTNGSGVFVTTLKSTKSQSILVTANFGTGSTSTNVQFTPGAASTFTVSVNPASLTVDQFANVVVTAYDTYGNLATSYLGTISFSSSDSAATLPSNYTFGVANAGVATFVGKTIFHTTGTASLTVADIAKATVSGTYSPIGVAAVGISSLGLGYYSQGGCAILSSQRAKCWGDNSSGELGYGDTIQRGNASGNVGSSLPYLSFNGTGPGLSVGQIVLTHDFGCALLSNNQVACWGANPNGQLGTGNRVSLSTPSTSVDLGSHTAMAVTAGEGTPCALRDDGQVVCWGPNLNGAVGLGDTVERDKPSASVPNLGSGRTALQVAAGGGFVCALLDNQNVLCWGRNDSGQLGLGDTLERHAPGASVAFPAGHMAMQISAGAGHACAVLENGNATCWGANSFGQLGLGDTTNRMQPATLPSISLPSGASAINCGDSTTCAILADRSLDCWGYNGNGGLGYGDTMGRSMPSATIPVATMGGNVTQVNGGAAHTCAVLQNGAVKCWGANGNGSLCYGDTTQRLQPVPGAISLW